MGSSAEEIPELQEWSGELRIDYESGLSERFRLPGGEKIVADDLTVRIAPSNRALRFSVEGRSANGSMVIESSSDLVTWESFSSITNYSGLAWTEISTNGPQKFYRAKAL